MDYGHNEFNRDYEKINVFQPYSSDERIETISLICKDLNLNWYNLIEIAVTDILNTLLDSDSIENQIDYSNNRQNLEYLMEHLNQQVVHNRLRIRGILYLLKAQLGTMMRIGYNNPLQIRPSLKVNYFSPLTESDKVDKFTNYCIQNGITAHEVLDIGLSWYGVDESIAYEREYADEIFIDRDRIGSGATVGKMINDYLKYLDTKPYDRILTCLLAAKAIMTSIMGVCPQNLNDYKDDNNDNYNCGNDCEY